MMVGEKKEMDRLIELVAGWFSKKTRRAQVAADQLREAARLGQRIVVGGTGLKT